MGVRGLYLQSPMVSMVIDNEELAGLADISEHVVRWVPQCTDDV